MWDHNDPKTKWVHLVLKLVAAILIFKAGVLVGEFKIVKSMVVGGSENHMRWFVGDDAGMMGAGARFFQKRVGPDERGNMMFWRGGTPAQEQGTQPAPQQ